MDLVNDEIQPPHQSLSPPILLSQLPVHEGQSDIQQGPERVETPSFTAAQPTPSTKGGKKSGGNPLTVAYKTVKRKIKHRKVAHSLVNFESLNCVLSNIIKLFDQGCGAYRVEGIYRIPGNQIKGLSQILTKADLTPDEMLLLLNKCFGNPVFDSKGQISPQTVHNLIYVLKNMLNGDDIQFTNGCETNQTIEKLSLENLVKSSDPAKTIQAHISALLENGCHDEAAVLHNLIYLFKNISQNQAINKMTEVNLANILAPSFFTKFFGLANDIETDPMKAFAKQNELINQIKVPFSKILTSDFFSGRFQVLAQSRPKTY